MIQSHCSTGNEALFPAFKQNKRESLFELTIEHVKSPNFMAKIMVTKLIEKKFIFL